MSSVARSALYLLVALHAWVAGGCTTLGLSESDDDFSMDQDPCGSMTEPDCLDDTAPFWIKVLPSLGPSDTREYELVVVNG